MKLFRRIAALALAVAIVAMFGISASAASFSENLSGDFGVGVGAEFDGLLTSSTARGVATFHGVREDIELVGHEVLIEYTQFNSATRESMDDDEYDSENENTVVVAEAGAAGFWYFVTARFYYNATYIANGVVDCYISCGPKLLAN